MKIQNAQNPHSQPDGHDENATVCANLRAANQQLANNAINLAAANQTLGNAQKPPPLQSSTATTTNWFGRLLGFLTRDTTSSLASLLIGLLLLLLLLTCCLCCLYCLLAVLRNFLARNEQRRRGESEQARALRQQRHLLERSRERQRRRQRQLAESGGREEDQSENGATTRSRFFAAPGLHWLQNLRLSNKKQNQAEEGQSSLPGDSLARSQNLENAARLKAAQALLSGHQDEETLPSTSGAAQIGLPQPTYSQQQRRQSPGVPPTPPRARQIQSILKRPGGAGSGSGSGSPGPAPLARFESLRPAEAQTGSDQAQNQQKPSERAVDVPKVRGALASSMSSARAGAGVSGDFRPTPAARSRTVVERQVDLRPQQQQQQGDVHEPRQMRFKSSSSQVEQTSSVAENQRERLTIYQYSSSVAQYSESYLRGLPDDANKPRR